MYKRFFYKPYLLCIHPEALEVLLEELHEGICGSHTGGKLLSHRAFTQGYWWSNMQKDAQEYVKKCDQCQRFAPNMHQLEEVLNPLSSPWSFAQWDLDIVGPFSKAVGNKRWLLVGIDYFTKWVEVEPLANIRDVLRDLFGKMLSPGLGFLIPSSRTMAFNLTVKPSRGTVVTWALRIGILPRLIHRGMDRPRLSISS